MVDASVHDLGQLTPTRTCVHVEGLLKEPLEGTKQKIELSILKVLDVGVFEGWYGSNKRRRRNATNDLDMTDDHTRVRVMGMVDLMEPVMLYRNRKRPGEDEVLMPRSAQSIQKSAEQGVDR
ncbi:hypothetical protein LIER_31527 [Lithospermum erythrorhizon]|uniref:Uncharacterized protein n=1 Tax=Lithospermum erythrorhizon TaxID=34254 RepID=A0AAV3RRZ1_LITER